MFLKTFYHNLYKFFNSRSIARKKEESEKEQKSNNYIDILISLNKEYNIDLLIYLNDNPINTNMSELEYGVICSEFINNCFTSSIKQKILSIINEDIKNQDNENLIYIINMASKNKNLDDTFIKPSQVFLTNNHG
jgi:hypothetical protein